MHPLQHLRRVSVSGRTRKSDAQVLAVDPALQYPNVWLMTNAYVERLETSASGREVTKVVVRRNGEYGKSIRRDVVVVSAGAINSAALLLRSANDRHPNGLANGSDVVGRHYMGHVNSILMAISKCPNPDGLPEDSLGQRLLFRLGRLAISDGPHLVRRQAGRRRRCSAGAPAIAPGFTLDLMANHSLDFWLTSEDLPDPDNRVTLDRDGNIVLRYQPEQRRRPQAAARQAQRPDEAADRRARSHGHECHQGLFARNLFVGERIPLAGVAHQNGTIRFGHDPKTSALDRNCKAHEVDNLYVVDGSFFPSSAAVNPALTIMANALRVGDHLIERMN